VANISTADAGWPPRTTSTVRKILYQPCPHVVNMAMYDPAQLFQGYVDHEVLRGDQYTCQGTTVSIYMSYEKAFAVAGTGRITRLAFALYSDSCPARQMAYAPDGMPRLVVRGKDRLSMWPGVFLSPIWVRGLHCRAVRR
jgi:hypothetical protein